MAAHTTQENFWSGEFGREYTDRNSRPLADWDEFYRTTWGLTKTEMNADFLGTLARESRILEVGCNTGMQLAGLQHMGFQQLYGVELQPYAVERAKEFTRHVNIVQGSGFDIPFKDEFFDVVCTNGVLIHIAPADLPRIMAEMVRCSRRYIWGFEYYSPELTTIPYRDNEGFLWKADYAKLFLEQFPELRLVKQELYPYQTTNEQGNVDSMYLLEKVAG
ncbi:pseudaminic acid biosynthesis-associated methylase [Hymenobacter sp. DG25A]|uniref:pseudaminic acid biosynthesis-associated methylase n=1 Tax=Hymenobacter sp. DG25A TaxID=1385663 RepID=UPI0006BCB352|nr:pseudaminic acid biosynthesis-associated methylase [Hymenobacter sp. DG25A]ALD21133.1 methyltransferase type 11 [Hymenobacter sp. DG25A]